MALPTPLPILFEENQQINRGKKADGLRAKGLKPSENPGKQERRALQNLSNISKGTGSKDNPILKDKSTQKQRSEALKKPPSNVTNTIKGTASKDKPILKDKSTQKQRSEALKKPLKILTDEEIKMCHEWAKDGMEGFHSTQNDSQKLDKDLLDKRVKKKVAAVNSALRGWSDTVFDSLKLPATEVAEFFNEPNVLELEPEILPDISWGLPSSAVLSIGDISVLSIGDISADDKADMDEDEIESYPSLLENNPVMFELRDEPVIPQLGVY